MPIADHVHQHELELYVRGRLESDRGVQLEFHISTCFGCIDRLEKTAEFVSHMSMRPISTAPIAEKRSERRFSTSFVGTMQVLRPLSFERISVQVSDMSTRGLALIIPAPLLPQALLLVRFGNTVVFGEVRYCVASENNYRVGVTIQHVVRP